MGLPLGMFNPDLLEKDKKLRGFVSGNCLRTPHAIMSEIAELNRRYSHLKGSMHIRLAMLCELMICKCIEYERIGVDTHMINAVLWPMGLGAPGGIYWTNDQIKDACWTMLERHGFRTYE